MGKLVLLNSFYVVIELEIRVIIMRGLGGFRSLGFRI